MSRIGKKPIPLPKGVEIAVDGDVVRVKGPKGAVAAPILAGMKISTRHGRLGRWSVRTTRSVRRPCTG